MDPEDVAALELQKLLGGGFGIPEQALLRIDYRQEARNAHFQFDMVTGTLHRSNCPAIPAGCRSALYAVWDNRDDWYQVACKTCRPVPPEARSVSEDRNLDLLYGLISIVDQFGTALRERGKEFRSSNKGKKLTEDWTGVMTALDQTQREALSVTLASLESLVKVMEGAKDETNHLNGGAAKAAPVNGNSRASARAAGSGAGSARSANGKHNGSSSNSSSSYRKKG